MVPQWFGPIGGGGSAGEAHHLPPAWNGQVLPLVAGGIRRGGLALEAVAYLLWRVCQALHHAAGVRSAAPAPGFGSNDGALMPLGQQPAMVVTVAGGTAVPGCGAGAWGSRGMRESGAAAGRGRRHGLGEARTGLESVVRQPPWNGEPSGNTYRSVECAGAFLAECAIFDAIISIGMVTWSPLAHSLKEHKSTTAEPVALAACIPQSAPGHVPGADDAPARCGALPSPSPIMANVGGEELSSPRCPLP